MRRAEYKARNNLLLNLIMQNNAYFLLKRFLRQMTVVMNTGTFILKP